MKYIVIMSLTLLSFNSNILATKKNFFSSLKKFTPKKENCEETKMIKAYYGLYIKPAKKILFYNENGFSIKTNFSIKYDPDNTSFFQPDYLKNVKPKHWIDYDDPDLTIENLISSNALREKGIDPQNMKEITTVVMMEHAVLFIKKNYTN